MYSFPYLEPVCCSMSSSSSIGSSKKQEFQKNIHFCFIDQTTLPAYWETCMKVNKQQLEMDMK